MSSIEMPQHSRKSIRKSVVAGSIGVFVHWFDWAVYAYMASTLAVVFFPEGDGVTNLLSVFAVFAVAFLVRPIGAVIIGSMGDKLGRKRSLSVVIILMAGATLVLGLLPGYDAIGIFAPILLILVRVVQGLAAGGEFGSAAAFLAEYSPAKKRGFGVSWLEFGSLFGFLFASFVVFLLHQIFSDAQVTEWAWRLPFFLTVPLGVIGFYIRMKIEDTPEFEELQALENVPKSPLKEVFRLNTKEFLQTGGIQILMQVTFYVVLVYLITYQEVELGLDSSYSALLTTLASAVGLIVVPLSGIVSDRVGRKPVLMFAAIALTVFSVPLIWLMNSTEPWRPFVSTLGLAIILAIILGTHAVTVAELFPTRTRQVGLSVAYALVAAIFAGTAPYIMTWLIETTNNLLVPGFMLAVTGVIGIAAVLWIPETRGVNLLKVQDTGAVPVPDSATVSDRT